MFGFNFRSLRKLKPIHHFFRSRILADDILKGKYEELKNVKEQNKNTLK
jgi:hypothetical protein